MPPRPIFGYTAQTCKGKWLRAGSKLLKNYVFNPYEVAFRALDIIGHLPCTVLPYSHTAAYPQGVRHSMYCAASSEWGLFGRNTRSAFRRTPSRE